MAKRNSLEDVFVQLTIPARLFSKKGGTDWKKSPDTFVRQALDEAFRICLGRCVWSEPLNITCTVEQFGHFVAVLKAKGHGDQITSMEYEMFRAKPEAKRMTFVVTEALPKNVHIPTREMPVVTRGFDG